MESQLQIVLPASDLNAELEFFYSIGFQLDQIFPSDDPAVAIISGHQCSIRLDRNSKSAPGQLTILTDDPVPIFEDKSDIISPNGTRISIAPKSYTLEIPETQHKFEIRKLTNNDPWVIGRAGMMYRDMIPDRLGGRIIASHINIPNGGPVPDMVHYHTIQFQLIYCYKGWVKIVYEDQGEPITLYPGDCVTQPPEIRHQVLEASDNLEVVEIGIPSDHMTTIDHDMTLPNNKVDREKQYAGQTFRHHIMSESPWQDLSNVGLLIQDTGIEAATQGLAAVHVLKKSESKISATPISHTADIFFSFILEGSLVLSSNEHPAQTLEAGDAFVTPPNFKYRMSDFDNDLKILQVALPGHIEVDTSE